ncbi:hypothetical protein D9M68_981260 [compost metagenome]
MALPALGSPEERRQQQHQGKAAHHIPERQARRVGKGGMGRRATGKAIPKPGEEDFPDNGDAERPAHLLEGL